MTSIDKVCLHHEAAKNSMREDRPYEPDEPYFMCYHCHDPTNKEKGCPDYKSKLTIEIKKGVNEFHPKKTYDKTKL